MRLSGCPDLREAALWIEVYLTSVDQLLDPGYGWGLSLLPPLSSEVPRMLPRDLKGSRYERT